MRLLPVLFLSLAIVLPCAADIEAIDLSALPQAADYQAALKDLLATTGYVDHYSPEWKYPIDKEALATSIAAFEARTRSLAETDPANRELRLFDLVLLGYLYNLDRPGVRDLIEQRAWALKADFPHEYRSYWLLGEFYASAAKPVQALREFDQAMSLPALPQDYPAAFHLAHAMAYMGSGMYRNAMVAFELAASANGSSPTRYPPYVGLTKALTTPDLDGSYKSGEIWELGRLDEGYRLTNRAMGLSIPVAGSWKLRMSDYSDRRAYAIITPDRLNDKAGRSIGISFLVLLSAGTMGYEDFVASSLSSMKVVAKERRVVNGVEFDVYTWDDPSQYQSIGGGIGYYAFARLPKPAKPGLEIEYPHAPPKAKGDGTPSFVPITSFFNRFDREIYVAVLLDSCHAIFEQASELYWKLLSESVFE